MTNILIDAADEAVLRYLEYHLPIYGREVPEALRPAVLDNMGVVLRQTHVAEPVIAARFGCSTELLQKMRRIDQGPPYLRLSAGLIRYCMWDVLQYEAAHRRVPCSRLVTTPLTTKHATGGQ